jgi:hypothetical protein
MAFLAAAALAFAPAQAGNPIKGWWTQDGTAKDYDFGTEHVDGGQGQKSAYIKCIVSDPKNYGGMSQGISASKYVGKRVRLSAMMKTKNAGSAQLWLRMDAPNQSNTNGGPSRKVLNFNNMNDRPVQGTTDWKRYDIVLDVPPETQMIAFGYFLVGKGEAWADSFKLETVSKDVPVSSNYPDQPVNTDFEQ